MKQRGLATQLISWILPATAIIFLGAVLFTYTILRDRELKEVVTDSRNLTLATAYKIESVLVGVEKVVHNIPLVIDTYPQTKEDVGRLIRTIMAGNANIYGMALAFEPFRFHPRDYFYCVYGFRQGSGITVTQLGSEDYNYLSHDWYQVPKELADPVWSEPYYDEGGGAIIMATYSVPFFRSRGGYREFQGVATADISLKWLQHILEEVKFYHSGYAFLVSRSGVFVTHPDTNLIMRESIFSVAEARNDPQLREIGRAMIAGKEGFAPLVDFTSGKKSWMYYAPLPASGWSLGVIFPEDELLAAVYSLSRQLLMMALLGLAGLTGAIIYLSRSVTRPLRKLAQTTVLLGQGDFNVSVPEAGAREIGHLAQSFNQLGRRLTEYIEKRDFIRDTFGRYVTQEVVKKLLESREARELGGETREISILMSDLRGFTAITADMEPEQVISFLNRYLGKMIEILLDHQAVIDEIIGDGILAFFGAPQEMTDHPVRAVACALAMQEAMTGINAANEADGLPHLEMGVAVNTGTVVVGNIGSERRTKYSAVGSQVNFTGRMEGFTLGGQVLISPGTYERVGYLLEVGAELQVEMKGLPGTVTLYDIRGISGQYTIRLPARTTVLVELRQRLPVLLSRLHKKIAQPTPGEAWLTRLSASGAEIWFSGQLRQWDDVIVRLLHPDGTEMQGKIYAKVAEVQEEPEGWVRLSVIFTSVSPQIFHFIREVTGHGGLMPDGSDYTPGQEE